MRAYAKNLCWSLLTLILFFVAPLTVHAAAAAPSLTVRTSGTPLYAQQDLESEPLGQLQKGDALFPIAESVAQEVWYMVRTKQGQIGWVRAVDVTASSETKDNFKEKEAGSSTWAARSDDGRTFAGTWSVTPESTARSARGFWTMRDANGATVMSGSWSAAMHTTGWNGTWRAIAEGRQGELGGSWSADAPPTKKINFSDMFEAAVKDAFRGLWTAGGDSGSWTIRTYK